MALKPNEQIYWEKYLRTLSDKEKPVQPEVTAGYAGSPEITDDLLALYLKGIKTAGSSIAEDFLSAGDRLPQEGDYWIYLDSKSEPRCILKTVRIVTHKFKDVPVEIAVAEGEGDLSLEYWRRVHSDLYRPFLKQWGVNDLDEATVVTEFFAIVYQ